MSDRPVLRLDRLDMTFAPRPWAFAEQRRSDIDAHFAACQKKLPTLWNGRVLMLDSHAVEDSVFRGTFIEVDYAAFRAWHDWGRPEAGVKDCFAQAALRAADGAFLLGVMSPHTANGGQIYFPSGTPDPNDVVGAAVDLEGSVWRELHEETGLTAADVVAGQGWYTVPAGPLVAHFKVLQAREDAVSLRGRICQTLSRQPQPELSDIRIVRGPADFDPMMADPIVAFLKAAWRN